MREDLQLAERRESIHRAARADRAISFAHSTPAAADVSAISVTSAWARVRQAANNNAAATVATVFPVRTNRAPTVASIRRLVDRSNIRRLRIFDLQSGTQIREANILAGR